MAQLIPRPDELAAAKAEMVARPDRIRVRTSDFAVCVGEGENARILILETKGMHLSGNPDTEYKRALLEKLSATNPRALECGDLTLKSGRRERRMVLRVLLEEGWEEEFEKLAAE